MNEFAGRLDGVVTARTALEREFEASLADLTRLAFRVAFSVLRHRENAEDVAQDAVTRAHGRLGQLRDRERLRAWVVRMTWRLAIDWRAADARRNAHEQTAPPSPPSPSTEDLAIRAQQSERLWTMIDGLSEKLRIVIVLSAIEGHEIGEVASMLRIPEGTVKRRLFDARQQLRERLR